MSKKGKIIFITSIILVICLILSCGIWMIAIVAGGDESSLKDFSSGSKDQTVAVIDIEGVITDVPTVDMWGNETEDMTTNIINKLEKAKNDEDVKAVLLRVDSPGGEVYATRKIYNKILELKDTKKPVLVLMESVAASGGYYLSAPADYIVASEMTMTGSIGVIFSTYDYTELYNKIGIEEIHVSNSEGTLKVMSDLGDKNSEGYKVLQALANDYYDNFVGVVASGRNMSKEEVIKIADGRVYSGKQALNNKLVDELGELSVAKEKVAELADLDDPNFQLYTDTTDIFSLYGMSLVDILAPENKLLKDTLGGSKINAYYLLDY